MQSELSPAKGLNMKLVPSLLVLAIAGSVTPDAAAGQKARPDPVVSSQAGDVVPMDSVLNMHMQNLVNEATNKLGLSEGETTMLIADIPNAPPSTQPIVILAQVNSIQQTIAQPEHVLGVCDVVDVLGSGQAEIFPAVYAVSYFKITDVTIDLASAKVNIIQQPKHGRLEPDLRGDWLHAKYLPSDGYLGNDSFVLQLEGNGYKVKLHYFMAVTNDVTVTTNPNPVCKGEQGRSYWKISQDPNGNSILTAVNYQSPFTSNTGSSSTDTAASASALSTSVLSTLSVDPSAVTFNIADLAGGALGQTVGSTITLDANAAGHNWFIDTTPADNSEFLPTSNPNEWVAKEGSAAYGKMDMLSVLLHERKGRGSERKGRG